MLDFIGDILGMVFLTLGVIVFILEIIGVFKYKYLLNRMHVAGMGDTLGLFFCMLGMILINGINLTSAKFALVVIFLWFASPTASHLISYLEASTNDELAKHAKIDVDKEDIEL